jgi:hypothetical protein
MRLSRTFRTVNMPPISMGPNGPSPVIIGSVFRGPGMCADIDTISFDELLQQIGAALEADATLGGIAFGLTYCRPEAAIEAVAGAPAIKSATLVVTVDYETTTPLA